MYFLDLFTTTKIELEEIFIDLLKYYPKKDSIIEPKDSYKEKYKNTFNN